MLINIKQLIPLPLHLRVQSFKHLFTFHCNTLPSLLLRKICVFTSSLSSIMVGNVAHSPLERSSMTSLDQKLAMAKRCSHEGVIAGAKAAVTAGIATAIPTLASVRMLPWARTHLNHTAQALIISTVAGAAYFIVADKTVLATARKNSFDKLSFEP